MGQDVHFSNITDEHKYSLDALKAMFPLSVQNIVWDQVCIRNIGYNSVYLFAEEGTNTKNAPVDHKVDTSKNKTRPIGAEWQFESPDGGASFFLKNSYLNEYMYASNTFSFSTTHRKCLTTKNATTVEERGPEYKWTLGLSGFARKVTMMSEKYREYLHTNNPNVFTFYDKKAHPNAFWSIEKC
jgi:hypothetical protein